MSETVVVRYTTRADAAAQNQQLIARVFRELNESNPAGLRYAAFQLDGGLDFVHLTINEGDDNPLARCGAFAEFQRGMAERLAGPVVRAGATLVGSYRLLQD
ncbi:hypothetical protein GCM10023322_07370 [Rugosimonospora acidiphila]|uniref:Quinol monooxygenase YgiN n=1 Tax=Rugosimonospora acidiphila TaxID=556531 RepID=A0ABP9RJI2_9ACTN